ncbi:MAG: serine acetyltransferase [candidate division Zixibacteria bacterium]|nr:serine acetyltransferase [candidate division Zixibacteria bacterium]
MGKDSDITEENEWKGAFALELKGYYFRTYNTVSPSFLKKIKVWVHRLGLHCVAVYRLSCFRRRLLRERRLITPLVSILYAICSYLVRVVYHVNIDSARIGPGLYIGHVGTIYIGPTRIGSNFSVTHNVTIGVGLAMGADDLPSIGDNVWVGTGSVITGGIKIGNNVTISAGSVLSRSVPDKYLVAGNPARVIMKNYDNSNFIIVPPEYRDKPVTTSEDPSESESAAASEAPTD